MWNNKRYIQRNRGYASRQAATLAGAFGELVKRQKMNIIGGHWPGMRFCVKRDLIQEFSLKTLQISHESFYITVMERCAYDEDAGSSLFSFLLFIYVNCCYTWDSSFGCRPDIYLQRERRKEKIKFIWKIEISFCCRLRYFPMCFMCCAINFILFQS